MYAAECVRALKAARSHSGEIAMSGSCRLCSTLATVPVLFAHADVTENIIFVSMGPKLRHPTVLFELPLQALALLRL